MRLKSLEIHGFKSFPDKTVINFDDGLTVIVGPNGSGKSNISDAIRWVLGEQSAKNIRSTKSEDVIFDGSSTRSPMGYAEVSLIIDNTGDGNRLPVDYDEVEVTRRYYRTGDSEYMINRSPARLKDIQEMFMNTGMGKTGYSIVSQGKAAEILSQKSEERRKVFEEAAGISKYRHQKEDAQRKLESTDENLIRLNDIKAELEARIGPLEKESEKAKKYLDIFEKKKQVDVSLWLYDVKDISEKLEKYENDFALAAKELEIADETIKTLENRSERVFEMSQQNKLEYEKNTTEIKNADEKRFGYESSLKINENETLHTNEALSNAEAELKLKNEEKVSLEASVVEEEEKFNKLSLKFATALEERTKADEALEKAGIELSNSETELKSLSNEITSEEALLVEKQIELSSLSGSRKSEDIRKLEITDEISKLEESLTIMRDRLQKAEKTTSGYKKKADEAKEKSDSADSGIKLTEAKKKTVSEELNGVFVELASKRQHAEALERMEEHFEGYANSVKFVMNEASKGTLNGIYGPVSKLISVEKKYTLAIETALGGNLQNIAVENEFAAKKAISLLKEKNAGRATFYPLTSIQANKIDADKKGLLTRKGYIGIASDLIAFEPKFRVLADFLLGKTVVFDNLDNAGETAKILNYSVRIVTLDGQIINAGGSYTGGSSKRDSGMLSRNADIEKLKKDCSALSDKSEKLENEIKELDKKIDDLKKERDSSLGNSSLLNSLLNAENTQYEVLRSQVEADEKQIAGLKEDLEKIEKSGDIYNTEKSRLEKECADIESKISGLKEKETKKNGEIEVKNSELEELRKQNSDTVIRLTEDRKDAEISEKHLAELKDDLTEVTEKISQTEITIKALKDKKQKNEEKFALDTENLKNTAALLEKLEKAKLEFTEKSDEFEKLSNELRIKIKEKTADREVVFRNHTLLEGKVTALKAEQDKSSERMWDEYELTYSSAKELGYPETTAETRKENASLLGEYKSRLKSLGNVNINAVEEYKEVKERYDLFATQIGDLEKSKAQFLNIINQLESEMKNKFTAAISDINHHFGMVFKDLFGGGKAEILLTEPENVLQSGIDIVVSPPGKIIKNLVALSGGEQSFVAIALFFAILKVNPTPFCIFDEIESALDEVNVVKFAQYARKYVDTTQFVMISHRRGTMEEADTLYGVTMYEKGISKVLAVNVREIENKLGIKLK